MHKGHETLACRLIKTETIGCGDCINGVHLLPTQPTHTRASELNDSAFIGIPLPSRRLCSCRLPLSSLHNSSGSPHRVTIGMYRIKLKEWSPTGLDDDVNI